MAEVVRIMKHLFQVTAELLRGSSNVFVVMVVVFATAYTASSIASYFLTTVFTVNANAWSYVKVRQVHVYLTGKALSSILVIGTNSSKNFDHRSHDLLRLFNSGLMCLGGSVLRSCLDILCSRMLSLF